MWNCCALLYTGTFYSIARKFFIPANSILVHLQRFNVRHACLLNNFHCSWTIWNRKEINAQIYWNKSEKTARLTILMLDDEMEENSVKWGKTYKIVLDEKVMVRLMRKWKKNWEGVQKGGRVWRGILSYVIEEKKMILWGGGGGCRLPVWGVYGRVVYAIQPVIE